MTDTASSDRRLTVRYVDLATIEAADRNPKLHDLPTIRASLTRFGIADVAGIVNDRTGKLVAGHGRITALREMAATGDDPPAGVHVTPDGSWTVPVLTGVSFATEAEAEAFLLAHNRTTELGGWDDESLSAVMADLQPLDLVGVTGYTDEEADALIAAHTPGSADFQPEEGEPDPLDERPERLCPHCGMAL